MKPKLTQSQAEKETTMAKMSILITLVLVVLFILGTPEAERSWWIECLDRGLPVRTGRQIRPAYRDAQTEIALPVGHGIIRQGKTVIEYERSAETITGGDERHEVKETWWGFGVKPPTRERKAQ